MNSEIQKPAVNYIRLILKLCQNVPKGIVNKQYFPPNRPTKVAWHPGIHFFSHHYYIFNDFVLAILQIQIVRYLNSCIYSRLAIFACV